MKKSLFVLLLMLCSVLLAQAQKVVSPAEFEKLLTNKEAQLIDVRTPYEYNEGHIKGAKNLNLFDDDFEKQLLKLNKSKPVLVYCEVGGRSGEAREMLVKAGFTEVYDLRGGIRAWKKEQKPVEK